MPSLFAAGLLLVLLSSASAQQATAASPFAFASVFGSDAVLQRDAKTAVYGFGTPGLTVTVAVTSDDTGLEEMWASPVEVRASGEWKAMLPPHAAGTGFTLTATSGSAKIALQRLAFGDLWFCSGQSNMELGLYYTFTRNQSLASIAAGKYDNIRLLHFDKTPLPQPSYVTNGSIATPAQATNSSWFTPTVAMKEMKDPTCHGSSCQTVLDDFSAACWYFAESLTDRMAAEAADETGAAPVPMGLIHSAYGGTCIESWLSEDAQLSCSNITCTSNQSWPYTKDNQAACAAVPAKSNSAGSNAELFNGMVLPFVNMTIKGFLWCEQPPILTIISMYIAFFN